MGGYRDQLTKPLWTQTREALFDCGGTEWSNPPTPGLDQGGGDLGGLVSPRALMMPLGTRGWEGVLKV